DLGEIGHHHAEAARDRPVAVRHLAVAARAEASVDLLAAVIGKRHRLERRGGVAGQQRRGRDRPTSSDIDVSTSPAVAAGTTNVVRRVAEFARKRHFGMYLAGGSNSGYTYSCRKRLACTLASEGETNERPCTLQP